MNVKNWNAFISAINTIPNIIANRATNKPAIPLAKLSDFKLCTKTHIPINIIPIPAILLKVKTLINGNTITIKPNIIARIPNKMFFVSAMFKYLLTILHIIPN